MEQRTFGNIGIDVSDIGFGAWAIGGAWGMSPAKTPKPH